MVLKTNIFLTSIIWVSLRIPQKHNSKINNAKIFHKNHLRSTSNAPKKRTESLRPIRQNYPYTDNEKSLDIEDALSKSALQH